VPANARRVADERHARGAVEETDMMIGMPRRVLDVQLTPARGDALAAFQDVDPPGRNGNELAPETVHILAVQAPGTGDELRGVDHVRRAALVHEDIDVGILSHERPGRAGVIEMDMREQDVPHIPHRHALLLERPLQVFDRGRRTWIDERNAGRAVQNRRRDDFRDAEKVEVDIVEPRRKCGHRKTAPPKPAHRGPAQA
jgi:hypothetical protein